MSFGSQRFGGTPYGDHARNMAMVFSSAGTATVGLTIAGKGAINVSPSGIATVSESALTGSGAMAFSSAGIATISGSILAGAAALSASAIGASVVACVAMGVGSLALASLGAGQMASQIYAVGLVVVATGGSSAVLFAIGGSADLIFSSSGIATLEGALARRVPPHTITVLSYIPITAKFSSSLIMKVALGSTPTMKIEGV